jgi:putative phage-type endonuclease
MNKKEKWIEQRNKGIGGSDASAVLGQNPYMTNVELWEYKTGRKKPEDISNKDYVIYGQKAERPLIELFSLDYPQYEVIIPKPYSLYLHPKYPFIRGTIDAFFTNKETGEMGILEVKTTNILQAMHREKWDNKIPQNYYIQCLHYMLVTGYTFCILKAQLKTEWTNGDIRLNTRHYRINYEDVKADIELLKAKEIEFWTEYVEKDRRPDLILPEI